MIDMVKKDILPAVSRYIHELSDTALAKKSFAPLSDCSYEEELITKLSLLTGTTYTNVKALEKALMDAGDITDTTELAKYYKDAVFAAMNELRIGVDELETLTDSKIWPYPSYGDLLFSVK